MTWLSTLASSDANPVAYAASVAEAAMGDFTPSRLEAVAAALMAAVKIRNLRHMPSSG